LTGNSDNPAVNFLASAVGNTSAEKFVTQYADFLLGEISCQGLPVELEAIVEQYNIDVYKVSLAGQRGLSTPDLGIFLEQDDRETVQRYSLAHEIMEFLFHGIDQTHPKLNLELLGDLRKRKEALCELGAANLLMPMKFFKIVVQRMGFNIETGKHLASACQVSLTAALRRMLDTRIRKALLIYFTLSNSSGEFIPSAVKQSNMFGPLELMDPPKKLRVSRTFVSSYGEAGFIPREKSIDSSTSIFKCYESGSPTSGFDELNLVNVKGNFFVESIPVKLNGERNVLSIIYLE
jgi:hypothetical protein